MTWVKRLRAWWRRRRVNPLKPWPKDRTPGAARFAPQRVEHLGDREAEIEERIERFDWRIRELERERALDQERFRRGSRA